MSLSHTRSEGNNICILMTFMSQEEADWFPLSSVFVRTCSKFGINHGTCGVGGILRWGIGIVFQLWLEGLVGYSSMPGWMMDFKNLKAIAWEIPLLAWWNGQFGIFCESCFIYPLSICSLAWWRQKIQFNLIYLAWVVVLGCRTVMVKIWRWCWRVTGVLKIPFTSSISVWSQLTRWLLPCQSWSGRDSADDVRWHNPGPISGFWVSC